MIFLQTCIFTHLIIDLLQFTTHLNTVKENPGLAKECRPTEVVLRNANLDASFDPS